MANETAKKKAVEALTILANISEEYDMRFNSTIGGLQVTAGGVQIYEGFGINKPGELKKSLDKLKEN